ncbi:uncharacterized protein [Nicotiana tomentosiformis]|uniref:uncharacterized protein n=1 Tax=Nicotiana tomentosiformis TaxID=4098 RepID=UPI00388C7FCB
MDLCGPKRVPSRGGKKYIFVIVDDYSRFTWTLFLRTKDDTLPIFVAFVKQIQVKMSYNVVSIRSDHRTEFDNAKCDEFCAENGIIHKFSAPRTPQQNGVVERKNRTLEDTTRTMLIDSGVAKGIWAEAVNTVCYLINSIHVIFDESCHLCGKDSHDKIEQDGEQSKVPGEVIDMANGKADLMSQVKESNEKGAAESPADTEELDSSITTTEAENIVVDVVQGTLDTEQRSGTRSSIDANKGSNLEEPRSSHNEIQVSNWKYKSSHPLQNVITPLDSGIQTKLKTRISLAFSALLSQIEPKNIKEALKYDDWITAMQDELH